MYCGYTPLSHVRTKKGPMDVEGEEKNSQAAGVFVLMVYSYIDFQPEKKRKPESPSAKPRKKAKNANTSTKGKSNSESHQRRTVHRVKNTTINYESKTGLFLHPPIHFSIITWLTTRFPSLLGSQCHFTFLLLITP